MTKPILLTALLLLASCAPYNLKKNLAYDQTVAERTFDYYEPTRAKQPYPTILYIHGGAWQSGDKSNGEDIADEFCRRGYAVVSINYRLAPSHQWPSQIEDCQAALAYLRSPAAAWMHLDTSRLAAFGISAGGHLASMLLLRHPTNRVTVAVSASGEGDLVNLRDQDGNLEALLGPQPWSPALLQDVSPTSFARQDAALLLVHSRGDTNVIFAHSEALLAAMQAKAADVSLEPIDGAEHSKAWKERVALIASWLDSRLHR